jgi:hypothetical protein
MCGQTLLQYHLFFLLFFITVTYLPARSYPSAFFYNLFLQYPFSRLTPRFTIVNGMQILMCTFTQSNFSMMSCSSFTCILRKSSFHDIYATYSNLTALCLQYEINTLHLAGTLSCRHSTCSMGTACATGTLLAAWTLCIMDIGHSAICTLRAAWHSASGTLHAALSLCNRHSACSLDTLQHGQ